MSSVEGSTGSSPSSPSGPPFHVLRLDLIFATILVSVFGDWVLRPGHGEVGISVEVSLGVHVEENLYIDRGCGHW